jgi:ketosteroid isomerase-like protein
MSNKEAIIQAFQGVAEGNGEALIALLAEDVIWTIIGTTAWSGTRNGKAEVFAKLVAPLVAALANAPVLVPKAFIGDGDYVVVEAEGRNRTRTGKVYNNTYCLVFRMANGKIQEVREYLDTALVEATLDPPQL